MNKVLLSTLVAALVCVAATSANAANGISSKTLSDMGLSGLIVMSDSDALAIRGLGYSGSRHDYGRDRDKKKSEKKPWSAVFGTSSASIESDDYKVEGEAETENAYAAAGRYHAAGATFSEAKATKTESEVVSINGVVTSVTRTSSLHVEAGGFANATSF
jgi:hypothetical protein